MAAFKKTAHWKRAQVQTPKFFDALENVSKMRALSPILEGCKAFAESEDDFKPEDHADLVARLWACPYINRACKGIVLAMLVKEAMDVYEEIGAKP